MKRCLRPRPQVLPRVRMTLQGHPAKASIVATLLVCTVVTPGFLPESSPHMPTVRNPHARPCFQGATQHRNCLDRRFWERRECPERKLSVNVPNTDDITCGRNHVRQRKKHPRHEGTPHGAHPHPTPTARTGLLPQAEEEAPHGALGDDSEGGTTVVGK